MTIERLEYLKRIIDCRAPIINKEVNAELHSLIDDEIERQKPCDYCNVGEIIYQKDYKTATRTGWIKPNYCPNCGRQLRGDE